MVQGRPVKEDLARSRIKCTQSTVNHPALIVLVGYTELGQIAANWVVERKQGNVAVCASSRIDCLLDLEFVIVGSGQPLDKLELIVVDGRGAITIPLGDVGAACGEEAVAQSLLVNARLEIKNIPKTIGNAVQGFLEPKLEDTFIIEKLCSVQ